MTPPAPKAAKPPAHEVEYCPHCGDELIGLDGPHKNVLSCVALCVFCGGLRPTDERYDKQEDDRCECDWDER